MPALTFSATSEVDEVAREQLDIGMDRAELDLSRIEGARHCDALGSRVGIIELPCDPFLEQVDVLGQPGMPAGSPPAFGCRLRADTIPGPVYRLKRCGRVLGRPHLCPRRIYYLRRDVRRGLAVRFANRPYH